MKKYCQAFNYLFITCLTGWMLILPVSRCYAQCSGITLNSYTGSNYQFNTYDQVMAGGTVNNYFTISYNLPYNTNCPSWKLKVRANSNFTNGSSSIDAGKVSLRFNSVNGGPSASAIGISTDPVALSTSDVPLINGSNAPLQAPPYYYFEHKFDMIIQGGNHLLAGTGTYTAMLTFTLYSQNDQVMAVKNVQCSFVVNFSNTCTGAAVSSYFGTSYNFTTYEQIMAGGTANEAVAVQYQPNTASCNGWSLKVRANGSFTNGTGSVDPQYVSLRFNRVSAGSPSASAIGISTDPVPLSTADVTLIDYSNASFLANTYTEHKFDMIIQGGNQLIQSSNGTYTTTLTFTLYNQNNQVISTCNVPASFQINYSGNNSYVMNLQNSADLIDINFNTVANYNNGVSVNKINGLKITGYSPYQVIVKTSGSSLTSGATSKTIPVEAIQLEPSAPSALAAISCNTINLSSSDQVIITNPLTDYTYQVVEYNLRYFTQPADNRLFSSAPGQFTTNVIFVLVPE